MVARPVASTSNRASCRAGPGSHACPLLVVGVDAAGPSAAAWPACRTDRDGDVLALWHGINPAHSAFGAVELPTAGIGGHSRYFDPGTDTLESIAEVVTGKRSTGP